MFFTNAFKCCSNSPLTVHLYPSDECLQAAQLRLNLKESEDLHRSLQNRMWLPQNAWLQSASPGFYIPAAHQEDPTQHCEATQPLCPLDSGQVPYFVKDKRENWQRQLSKAGRSSYVNKMQTTLKVKFRASLHNIQKAEHQCFFSFLK